MSSLTPPQQLPNLRLSEILGQRWRRVIEDRRPQILSAIPEALARLTDAQQLERRIFIEHTPEGERPAAAWLRGETMTFGPMENADARWIQLRDGFAEDLADYGFDLIENGSSVAFVGPPARAAIVPHADRSDLLVIHLGGRKKWRVFHRGGEARAYSEQELGPPTLEATLEANEVLFLPQGYVHEATPLAPGPCCSVSFGYRLAERHDTGATRFHNTPLVARPRNAGMTSTPTLSFRPLRLRYDLAQAIAFREDAERASFGEVRMNENEYVSTVSKRLAERPKAVVLAWLDETPVGQVELNMTVSGEGYVNLMYLRPLARGVQLGEALDRWADQTLGAWGAKMSRLRVAKQNESALRFYERMGWKRVLNEGELIVMERKCPAG